MQRVYNKTVNGLIGRPIAQKIAPRTTEIDNIDDLLPNEAH